MHVTAIIAAGGRGARFGAGQPKQLLPLGGVTILQRSVDALLAHPSIDDMVVALPAEIAADPPAYLRRAGKPVVVVEGGARRQDSVARAFARVPAGADIVVIHDGHHRDPRADRRHAAHTVRILVPQMRARGFQFKGLCD